MANLKARDSDLVTRFIKATGEGTEQAPYIVEHLDSAVFDQLLRLIDKTSIALQQNDVGNVLSDDTNKLLNTLNVATAAINNKVVDLAITQTTLDAVRTTLNNLLIDSQKKGNITDTQPVSLSNIPLASGAALESRQLALSNQIDTLQAKVNQIQTLLTDLINVTGIIKNFPATQAIIGNVNVNNFPTSQNVAVSNFPASQPITGNVGVSGSLAINNFPQTTVIADNHINYLDSFYLLGANVSYTASMHDGSTRNSIRGWVFTDRNGTLHVEQSRDANTWRRTESIPITGNNVTATTFLFRLYARYYRLVYVNGNNAQTNFELNVSAFGLGL